MRFDRSYREHVTLPDGTEVLLRLILPSDKQALRDGLARTSDASRFLRFFSAKPHLSERELRYLTEVDGHDHLALVAGIEHPDGTETGLGVARFIRSPADPEEAEAAIAIVDAYQGRGLGTLLMDRLSAAAREHGIRRLSADFLARNEGILHMLDHLAERTTLHTDGDQVHAVVALDEQVEHRTRSRRALAHVLAEVAAGRLPPRRGLALLKGEP